MLKRCRYVRSLSLPHGVPPALLCCVPRLGAVLAHSHMDLALHLYSVNCRHIASAGASWGSMRGGAAWGEARAERLRAVHSREWCCASNASAGAHHVLPAPPHRHPLADTHERLAALCPSPDGRLLLAAGTSGRATLRWLHSLQVVLRYDAGRGPITSLAVTPEQCFLAGTAEGSLVLFAPDPRRTITRRFNLAA